MIIRELDYIVVRSRRLVSPCMRNISHTIILWNTASGMIVQPDDFTDVICARFY